jgi:hypothetical protein
MADQTPQHIDLSPEIIHLEVQQGTDVVITFQLMDDQGDAVNITGDTVKLTAKDDFAGTVKIATKINAPGQHVDPEEGMTRFTLSKANLTTPTPSEEEIWWYEVRRVFAGSGREVIYIHGQLQIKPSVGLSL